MPDRTAHIDLVFPPAFLEFARQCEVYCVAGCCGLDAFSFDDETVGAVIDTLGLEKVADACEAGITFAASHQAEKRECRSCQYEFGDGWTNGEEFFDWMDSLVSNVREQIKQRMNAI